MFAFLSAIPRFFRSAHQGRRRSQGRSLEQLEPRTLLASMVSASKLTYQDVDGDDVSVTFSKAILTAANVNSVFTFDTGSVNGSNAVKQQLRSLNLVGIAGAGGVSITTVATRNAVNKGDGYAALGQINATGIDLGKVTLDGDLGRILAGDASTGTSGVVLLSTISIGRYGTLSGATNLNSVIQGTVESLKTKTDIKDAFIDVQGGANGKIGSVTIGGSLIGGALANSGELHASGAIGPVSISRDLNGGTGANSGSIQTLDRLGSVSIGGSLHGGSQLGSGKIYSHLDMGAISVTGNVVGGSGDSSGLILSDAKLTSVTIGGSLLGGSGQDSGEINSDLDMGAIKVGGNVSGGSGKFSGAVTSNGYIASVTIGGSLIGGAGSESGYIFCDLGLGNVVITGNIIGGSASGVANLSYSGAIEAGVADTITVGGSLIAGTDTTTGTYQNNGAILILEDVFTVTLGGILGNATNKARLFTGGQGSPTGTVDLALGTLNITGRVEYAQILAGYDSDMIGFNADAQIGNVTVGGDWIASDLVAGASAGADGLFGTPDDVKLSGAGVKDVANVFSKIGSLTIGGHFIGTPAAGDYFGIVAQSVGSLKVSDTVISLLAGNSNDHFLLTNFTNDLRLNEI